MWNIIEKNNDYVKRQRNNEYELSYKNGSFARWLSHDNGNTPCDKLVNLIPSENEEAITVPNGVTEIGYGAFAFYETDSGEWTCVPSNLKSVTLPSSVTHVESGAFAFLELKEVVLNGCTAVKVENGAVLSPDGARFIYKLLENDGTFSYEVPNGVTEIAEDAFFAFDMNVILPPTVKQICSNAFGVNFCNVVVPASVNKIGKNAFSKYSTMVVERNSYAHKWAKRNKVKFEFIKNK